MEYKDKECPHEKVTYKVSLEAIVCLDCNRVLFDLLHEDDEEPIMWDEYDNGCTD
jgi:hypothetical protein